MYSAVTVENACHVEQVTRVVFKVARLIGVDDRTFTVA